ncbi:MAG: PQQ-binding-like beta-propeller repeat protein [bacterium]
MSGSNVASDRTVRLLALSAAVLFLACPHGSPTVPAPPAADARGDSLAFFTSSADPGGQPVACVFDWGDGTFDTSAYVASGDTAWACHAFADTGSFAVRARAVNALGRWSGWSDAAPYARSLPPFLVDTLLGPRWYGRDRWCRFRAVVSDADGDSVSARFRWGDGTASAWSLAAAPGDTVLDSVRYAADGIYQVRVDLRDARGTITAAAAGIALKVSRIAPLWIWEHDKVGYEASAALGYRDGELRIYSLSGDLEGVACHAADGRLVWSTRIWGEGMFDGAHAPSLNRDGSRLFVVDDVRMRLNCLDADNGRICWQYEPGMQWLEGTPAIGPNDEVYVTSGDPPGTYRLIRLADDGDSARVVWRVDFDDCWSISPCPAVGADGTVYVACETDTFVRLSAVSAEGNLLWASETEIPTEYYDPAYPVIDGRGRILLPVTDHGVYCFDPDGTLVWSNNTLDPGAASLVVGPGDAAYCLDQYHPSLVCFDVNTGNENWSLEFDELPADATPVLAADGSILLTEAERVYLAAVDRDGNLLWEFSGEDSLDLDPARARRADEENGDASVVIGPDGNAYLPTVYEGLWCISLGDLRLATAPWPTYNHDPARSGWAGRR